MACSSAHFLKSSDFKVCALLLLVSLLVIMRILRQGDVLAIVVSLAMASSNLWYHSCYWCDTSSSLCQALYVAIGNFTYAICSEDFLVFQVCLVPLIASYGVIVTSRALSGTCLECIWRVSNSFSHKSLVDFCCPSSCHLVVDMMVQFLLSTNTILLW
ncbi:hypothetical protein Tco_0895433 [Tanacetum coccineum]|uniref:Uncharacterized protein n=1 Tax=Tanacetum coccineum TaxID=301880 RepID=A0ABQ5CEK3_9ASTR